MIRQYARCWLSPDSVNDEVFKRKFKKESFLVYIGEIPNMPGHCIVAGWDSGKLYSGYHTDTFIEIGDDE
jgi:hypothetical protein